MEQDNDPKAEMARQLFEAIERVRADVAKVELWACVMTCFAQPVPDYEPGDISVWLPHEQAKELKDTDEPQTRIGMRT